MAKKKKRQVRGSATVETSPVIGSENESRRSERDFNPDYSYVIKDLKRIGTLAGSFFIILIILAFILN